MRPFVMIFLPLIVAYALTLVWCVERWNAPTDYFAHCWLLPIVAAFVLWQRRHDWRARPRGVDRTALWLLVPGLVLHFAGALLMIDSWSAASLALTLPGACWFALGRARLVGLWPVLWLVLFAIPAPIYVEGRLAFMLKEVAVAGGSWLANVLGADVVRTGDRLQPTGVDGSLFVADACGGLRSLLAMLTLAYCLAFFSGPANLRRRLSLLLVAAPMAIAANVARIAALCLMARWFGVPFAEGSGHSVANVVEWVALLLALVGFDRLLVRRIPGGGETATVASISWSAAANVRPGRLWPVALALWLLAGPLLWLTWYRPFGDRSDRAERLPASIAGYQLEARSPEGEQSFQQNLPRWRELLGTEDFVWRRYRDERGALISLVALFHDTNWKSVHPPRICIEGSGMDIERDDLVGVGSAEADFELSRIVAKNRQNGWRYVTLSVFGTSSWTSGDYWEFTLHHLPLALLRRNESGFLLRVESPIYRGETDEPAERRCRTFLEQLLPMARELAK